jgi:hypothetical protein
MTDLFTEALRDAEKLKEIAEQDAKNRLIEQLTPYIRKVIAKEVAGSTDFFFEQDEEVSEEPESVDPQGQGGTMPTTAPATTTDPTQGLSAGLGDQPQTAPVEPVANQNMVGASMPDADGKIVVDFDDLFVDAETDKVTITPGQAPVQPTGTPAANTLPAPTTTSVPAPETAVQPSAESNEETEMLAVLVTVNSGSFGLELHK